MFFFLFQAKAMGRVLFEQVCKQLHLLEADYFGLEYADVHGTKVINLQVKRGKRFKNIHVRIIDKNVCFSGYTFRFICTKHFFYEKKILSKISISICNCLNGYWYCHNYSNQVLINVFILNGQSDQIIAYCINAREEIGTITEQFHQF